MGIQIVYFSGNASEMASGNKKYNVTVSIEIGSSLDKIQAAYWINDNDKASRTRRGTTEGNGLQKAVVLPLQTLCENEISVCYPGRENALAEIKQALESRLLEDEDAQRLREASADTGVDCRTVVRRIYQIAKATVNSCLNSEIGGEWTWSRTVLVVSVLWTQADEQSAAIQKLLEEEAEAAGILRESIEFEWDVEAVLAVILQNRLSQFPKLKQNSRVMIADFSEQCHAFAAFEIRPESTLQVFPISRPCGGRGAFSEALRKLGSEMGKARELQYLVVVGTTLASNDKVQSMIRTVAEKHDTEVCFAQSDESRRAVNGDGRARIESLQTDNSIDACRGAVMPWPKWTATDELQAACFGLAVQDSRKRSSAENDNENGTDSHIEDIVLPSKSWGESFEKFEEKFEAIRIAPEAKAVTLFPVYLSLEEESVVLPKKSKDTDRKAWSTKGATYMDPIKVDFGARSQGLITYRFRPGSTAERIILEVIHPLSYRRLEFVVSRERWRIVLELCKDDSPSNYDIQKSIFAIGFDNRAFKVVWDQGRPQHSKACWYNDKWKTWTLYRRPVLPEKLIISRGCFHWANAGFCPVINFKAPKLSRNDRLVFIMLQSEGNSSGLQLYVNVEGSELFQILETSIDWEDAVPLSPGRMQDLKESFSEQRVRGQSAMRNEERESGQSRKPYPVCTISAYKAMLKGSSSTLFKDDDDDEGDVGDEDDEGDEDDGQSDDTRNDSPATSGLSYYRHQSHEEDFQSDQSKEAHEYEADSDRSNSYNSGLGRPPSPFSSEKGLNLELKRPDVLYSTGKETPGRAYVSSEGSSGSRDLSRPPTPYYAVSLDGQSSRSASPVKEAPTKGDENEVVSVSSDSGTPGTTSEEHGDLMHLLEQLSTEPASRTAEDRMYEGWVPPISRGISHLHAGKRLSDEIVNFYLECILKKREDTLLLNSFFFTRLCEKSGNIGDQEIRKLGLFSKRYRFVVIPIFDKSREHWRIAVMCDTANATSGGIDQASSVRNAGVSQWSIVITMDSYFDEGMEVKQPLQELLIQAGKIGPIAIEADNDLLEVRAQHLPKQDNNYDCGVYILGYMKLFFQDPDVAIRKILAYEELGWELNATTQRLAIQRAMDERR